MKKCCLSIIFIILFSIIISINLSADTDDNVSEAVFIAWRENRSYYALLEILDAYIDPSFHKATKSDVIKYIGEGSDIDIFGKKNEIQWYYTSHRRPNGSVRLIITFNDDDIVTDIQWASE
jgi:hypothetical protein